jgi:hypothetical protein
MVLFKAARSSSVIFCVAIKVYFFASILLNYQYTFPIYIFRKRFSDGWTVIFFLGCQSKVELKLIMNHTLSKKEMLLEGSDCLLFIK